MSEIHFEQHCCLLAFRPAAIHRQWSQRSLSCPLVPDMDTKRPTGQEPSIVITNSDNEGNTVENKDHVVRDLGAETVSTNSSNASALSTDSFDSGDEWGDSDDVLDMDLVSFVVECTCV